MTTGLELLAGWCLKQQSCLKSQMAYDVSATPLRQIFPQFLAMIVQFYEAGKAAAVIIAAAAATADIKHV